MYLAMSRLKVAFDKEVDFEASWKKREQNIDGVKGFKEFSLYKGDIDNKVTLYIFHSKGNSETDFINWTKSDFFQIAHKDPTSQSNLYLGPPDFNGYIGLPDFEGFKLVI